ncbi:hypothetical protein [Aeromonas salmonicida]|uniref:hypothetical protein n=1 Tax=Aeromonas salmonicida TaxID=645 RepID=UPI00232D85A6|nr:hypothetical protein [Aeromonas salmonicida]WCH21122.1 hypothetical protein ONZ54_13275 [Aeromonas salmonicida]
MMSNKKTMIPEAVFRIHSAEARSNRSMVSKDSFTARAQKAIAAPPHYLHFAICLFLID